MVWPRLAIPYRGFDYFVRVRNILSGKSEADNILFRYDSEFDGFVILPDMKWDLINVPMLYLVAIAFNSDIRTLRDLRKSHLEMLRRIRTEATRVVKEKWSLDEGSLRFFIHYQPSYCEYLVPCTRSRLDCASDHFHVHIVNVNYAGTTGMSIGQAHLLEDVISLVNPSFLAVW